MPVYFTLQEALAASQTAHKDYNPRMSGGREGKAIFSQKLEIKPVVKGKIELGDPIIKPTIDPEIDPNKALQEELERKVLAAQHKLDGIDVNSSTPVKEVYKEPPSLIVGASFVLIDPIRADAQDVHGAQAVQARYAQQNDEAWMVKPWAKKSREAKKAAPKVVWTTAKIVASSVRHPIATAQNMVRDPFENRDIHFAYTVNEMVKKKLFPNNPELALLVPDNFIDKLLIEGRKKRNLQGSLKKNWNAIKDFLPTATTGFVYDTQQKRALEYLGELMTTDPDGLLKDIEDITMEGGTKLAKRFSQTFVRGDDVLSNQVNIGNNHILLLGEKREQIKAVDEVTHQDIIETKIKEKIKPFVDQDTEMTLDEKKQLVKEVTQIYIENVPKDKLDKKGKPKGEAVVDVLDLIAELKKDPDNREYYQKHWPELKIISYVGESKGDTLGGQERFLTWNQKLAINCAKNGNKLNGGWTRSAVQAVAKIGVYTSGFALSYGLGVAKLAPRTGVNGILLAVSPFLGPAVAGSVAGLTETQSVHLGKFYQRRSRIDNDLARTSRGKALGEKPGELDAVRGNLENATVETVPAEALTTEINKLILVDPNNFGSETRTPANKEEVLQLLTHMAHARARLDLTMRSGSKDLNFKTSNWVSYHAGREQEELTNLTGAGCQALARLMRLQVENPTIFYGVPFLPTPDGDLNEALKSMTTVIKAGLMEGLPSELIDGSPLSTFKGQKFYRQIFNASGIPETETDQAFDYINSLKTTSKVGIKTVGEWMDEAESYKSRMKALEKIRNSRFRFAAVTGMVTSEIIGGLKHVAQPGIDQVEAQFKEHVVQPIVTEFKDHFAPNQSPVTNNNAPVSLDQSPDINNPSPDTNNQSLTIDFPNIFKEPSNGVVQIFKFFNEDTGKTADVKIPLADGFKFVPDGKNIDIQGPDGKIYDNVFVFDPKHNALVPNEHFVPPGATSEVDLGQVLNFKTEQDLGITSGGETPVKLTGGAAIVDYLKEHYKEAMTTIAHRDVMKEQHALTTFIDSEGKIHITQGGYTAPNAYTEQPDNLTAGLESGNGALWFTFGKNADGSATPGVPLSFEGIKVPLEWNGHHGEFVFDPHHPTTPQEVLLAKLIDQNALNEFKTNEPNQWLNESDLGKLWMGIRGYEGGYESNTPDGIKMHNFEMEFAGEDNKLTIAPPESTIPIETTSLIPPGKIDVPIPVDTILEPEVPPIQPTPTDSTFLPFPGPYHSPQLHPTTGETPIPVSSTPLPQSIINVSEFKKEKQPNGYNNSIALTFLNSTTPTEEQIDNFIYEKVFNQKQKDFLAKPISINFISRQILPKLRNQKSNIEKKLQRDPHDQMTNLERNELKTIILEEAKSYGLTAQEALTAYTYLVNRSYLDSLNSAVQEKKLLDEQLRKLEVALSNATALNISPRNPPTAESAKKIKLIDEFTSKIISNYPNLMSANVLTENQLIELNNQIESELEEFIINNFLTSKQNNILQEMKELKRTALAFNEIQEVDENIFNKLMTSKTLSIEEKNKLRLILDRKLHTEEAETFHIFLANINSIASQVREKMEQQGDSENLSQDNGVVTGNQLFEIYAKENRSGVPKESSTKMEIMVDKYLPALLGTNINRINKTSMAIPFYRGKNGLIDNLARHQSIQSGPDSQELEKNLKRFNDIMQASDPDNFEPRITKLEEFFIQLDDVKIDLKTGEVIFPENWEEVDFEVNESDFIEEKSPDWLDNDNVVEYWKSPKKDEIAEIPKIKVGEFEGKEVFEIYGSLLKEGANANIGFKNQIESAIAEFEQSQLPIILGGTFDTIITNPNDAGQVHSFFYHEFRNAFRKYMVDYVYRGRDADNAEIKMAFNILKSDFQNIDPSVNIVRFEEFMDDIRSAVS